MKKRILALFIVTLMITGLAACKKKSDLIQVNLNEVAHSIFYAPQYVAIEKGYFEEEGLDVNLVNGLGADKTMTAVLSGDADIGFMGSEASIYVYNEGNEDYVVNFAQLTQRAGNFLVSRDMNEEFTWDNIKGKTVIGGRVGGMPEMVFEYILKKHGIDPTTDLTIIQNIDFGITSQSFAAGTGDYTIEFEPAATGLETQKAGKVVASLGVESGMVPYTAYSAKTSFIKKNPEVIEKFVKALQKGMDYVNTHSPEEIAKVIEPQFKETGLETITKIVTRYYDQDTWKDNLVFEQESFDLLQDILMEAGVITEKAPYEKLVNTSYATDVAK
ncbi:ABC transporter substrate-binding protein [Clostridium sp. Marseille-P299]|uniref:ABC transporter substrate-binding protein n=1 Tax=Clostridium sp. Marseille-P299 TaxID=1805477 RepID=UPI00082DCF39|nr:ABC transporter substrate-binding protein [Clostridium sp. Marseille-P299]